ncbi:MAG: ATP-binding protein [Bacteroidetes bacterium]|nr:MAG: ATP-binding protein [Bacteroidota bacterium]
MRILWDLDSELPSLIGCAVDFNQVFGNLLRNAAEAMLEMKEMEIRIRTQHVPPHVIRIVIEDRGPGVPQHLRERIFQPFFSTKTASTANSHGMGMGIGLHHCRELLLRYRGTLVCEGAPEGGARFVIDLPLSKHCHA